MKQPAIVRRCFDETTNDEEMEVRKESGNEQQRSDNKGLFLLKISLILIRYYPPSEILMALEAITQRLVTIETNVSNSISVYILTYITSVTVAFLR